MKATKMKKNKTFFKVLTILQETTHTKAGVSHNFSLFFFPRISDYRPATLSRKKTLHRYVPVNLTN